MVERETDARACVWAWGWNTHGQLGQGQQGQDDTTDFSEPKYIQKLPVNVTAIACGHHHSCAVTRDGMIYTWGDGGFGKLGHGDTLDVHFPKKISSLTKVKMVRCATAHTIVLTSTGALYSWGTGYFGTLGHGDNKPRYTPTQINALRQFVCVKIAAGGNSSAAVTNTGEVYVWGMNKNCQLGLFGGGTKDQDLPVLNTKLSDLFGGTKGGILKLELGDKHGVIVGNNGELYTWGYNVSGQLGVKDVQEMTNEAKKVRFPHGEKVIDMSTGIEHVAAVTDKGFVYTWGCAADGRLGHIQTIFAADGSKSFSVDLRNGYTPKQVEMMGVVAGSKDKETLSKRDYKSKALQDLVQVSCGACHTAVLDKNGLIWAWGSDKHGQLGYREVGGDNFDEPLSVAPRLVEPMIRASAVECGGYHCLAIVSDTGSIALQLIRDNELINFQSFLSQKEGAITFSSIAHKTVDESNGFTPAHWCAYLGHIKMMDYILYLRGATDARDFNGDTYFHIAVTKGNIDMISCIFKYESAYTLCSWVDERNGDTPLHLAVKLNHLAIARKLIENGADIEAFNNEHNNPVFYCKDLKDRFKLKKRAQKHEFSILYQDDCQSFAAKLQEKIEQDWIRCYRPPLVDQESKIADGIGVIFIVSEDTAKSENCLDALKKAKQLGKAIVALWYKKTALSSMLEALIFRHQLVDFTNADKFNDSSSQLLNGLRNLVLKGGREDQTEEEEEGDEDHDENKDHSLTVFVSFDAADEETGNKLIKGLQESGVTQINIATPSLNVTTKLILHCCVFVVIMSAVSFKSKKVRDQIALAENHKKPLLPIFLEQLKLDPAMEYTLASCPKYFSTDADFHQLVSTVKIHQQLAQLKNEETHLHKEAEAKAAEEAARAAKREPKQNGNYAQQTTAAKSVVAQYWSFS